MYIVLIIALLVSSCSTAAKINDIKRENTSAEISISNTRHEEISTQIIADENTDTLTVVGINGEKIHLMRNFVDSLGNTYVTENLSGVIISARFQNIAERNGMIDMKFDLNIPEALQDLDWQLKFQPYLTIQSDSIPLDEVIISGSGFITNQRKEYDRYQKYLETIITDSTLLRNQRLLEIFLVRNRYYHLPPFRITPTEIINHYKKGLAIKRNNKRIENKAKAFEKYIKNPLSEGGSKLDTVIYEPQDFTYTYTHSLKSIPGVKKMGIIIKGRIIKDGETIYTIDGGKPLSYYISSLSTLYRQKNPDDPEYQRGIFALMEKEYQKAIEILRPYMDINTAIAYLSLGHIRPARQILEKGPQEGTSEYLLALIAAMDGDEQTAVQHFLNSIRLDENMKFRGNIDPEISFLIDKYSLNQIF